MCRTQTFVVVVALLVAVLLLAVSQLTITGKVTDSSGEPLPGAAVLVKGTPHRTTTDAQGNYRLVLPSAPAKLEVEVRFTGFAALTRTVSAQGPKVKLDFVLRRLVVRQPGDIVLREPARVETRKPPKAPPKQARRRPRPIPQERPVPAEEKPPVPSEQQRPRPVPTERPAPVEVPSAEEPPPDAKAHSLALVDSILNNLANANVAFNTPPSLNLKESATIQLLLDTRRSVDELGQMIRAEGEKQGSRVRVASRMEARLTGPGFEITAITPEEQAVSSLEPTEWRWEVKPTRAGRHNLHLTLTALLNVGDATSRKAIRTFDKTIVVEVSLGQRASMFVDDNWQWLWTVVLVPLAGWLLRIRRKAARG